MKQMVVGVREEGGMYIPSSDESLPIRFYSDGTIEDDYCAVEREPVDTNELARICAAARENVEPA